MQEDAEEGAEPKHAETLVAEMEALPAYRGWGFTYEYPGYFCYSHDDLLFSVFFTPDWDGDETLGIQVQDSDGRCYDEHSSAPAALPHEGRTGQKIFELVKPTLDKLLELVPQKLPKLAPLVELRVFLTPEEIAALQKAREHVRVHMAHEHSWDVRDAAMEAIGKVLTAARDKPESWL